jgi:hypothetical protein
MKKLIAATLFLAPLFALAQIGPATQVKVTVAARGHDVRQVLTDVFQQAKKSCVIQRNIQGSLYLSLENTPFDQALEIICKQSGLTYEIKDGIYYVSSVPPAVPAAIRLKPVVMGAKIVRKPVQVPTGKLPASVLNHIVNTRLIKAPIRVVLQALGDQAGVKIELDPQVPAYRLDAFLIKTSLRYALDQVTTAANLTYRFTDHQTILVTPMESRVSLIQ